MEPTGRGWQWDACRSRAPSLTGERGRAQLDTRARLLAACCSPDSAVLWGGRHPRGGRRGRLWPRSSSVTGVRPLPAAALPKELPLGLVFGRLKLGSSHHPQLRPGSPDTHQRHPLAILSLFPSESGEKIIPSVMI